MVRFLPRNIGQDTTIMGTPTPLQPGSEGDELQRLYGGIRRQTRALVAGLSDADATAQSMPDASPAKWHLAHTTWFFEAMVLQAHDPAYRTPDPQYAFLFNSYYETMGPRHARPKRGLLTRPTLAQIDLYRDHVDAAMATLLEHTADPRVRMLVELGCHHEQQHQELLLTDILHLFAQNPLHPAYAPQRRRSPAALVAGPVTYTQYPGGVVDIGHSGTAFAFDCECPRHSLIRPTYRLANRCVTNREWLEFIVDGGYRTPLLWLSDGWAQCQAQDWTMPLYWWQEDREYFSMTLHGAQPLELDAPVAHVSYFEADAFASWSGSRLPTESEWESAAQHEACDGNFADSGWLRPVAAAGRGSGPEQLFGDVWEWTRSAFLPYPGYRPSAGAIGEYNGKFMSGQYVLRGGSCVTPAKHIRASYRNFFRPDARWQFSGVRLAQDA
jgi:ergothioneine biosynthesis protein EgtB